MTQTRPLGLYVHVPFCERKCPYCDFNTYDGLEDLYEAYSQAVCLEIAGVAALAPGRKLDTIFIGGGTPTVLSATQLRRILDAIGEHFELADDCELSSEANPGTVDLDRFADLRALGVNRLSMGVQSFQPDELELLGRLHSAEEAERAFGAARSAGFDTISLDLMFGLPGQPLEPWRRSLERVITLAPEHLSLYSLIVEPKTPLARWVAAGDVPEPSEDRAAEQYALAREMLGAAGYRHYEVSNWAREQVGDSGRAVPGLACRHNLGYWRNGDYLAVGPGAHGCLQEPAGAGRAHRARRWWNVRGVPEYLRRLRDGETVKAGEEWLEGRQAMGESLMLGLRLIDEGLPYDRFEALHGKDLRKVYPEVIAELEGWSLLRQDAEALRLTERGLLMGNRVFERFIEA